MVFWARVTFILGKLVATILGKIIVVGVLLTIAVIFMAIQNGEDLFAPSKPNNVSYIDEIARLTILARQNPNEVDWPYNGGEFDTGLISSLSCKAIFETRAELKYGKGVRFNVSEAYKHRDFIMLVGAANPASVSETPKTRMVVVMKKFGRYLISYKAEYGYPALDLSSWPEKYGLSERLFAAKPVAPETMRCFNKLS